MYTVNLGFGAKFGEQIVRAGMFGIRRVPLNDASAEFVLKDGGYLVLATGEIVPTMFQACQKCIIARSGE